MDREAGILQDRVQVAPFDRRAGNAQERVGREDQEGAERAGNQS